MTTKEQERKALEQIRKIVTGLGEDSYIGIAFEGCFEVAEENIENDFACSMKQRAEAAEKREEHHRKEANRFKDMAEETRKHAAGVEENLQKTEAAYEAMLHDARDQLAVAQEARDSARDALCRAESERDDMEHKLLAAQDEILKLKAKLFDLLYSNQIAG